MARRARPREVPFANNAMLTFLPMSHQTTEIRAAEGDIIRFSAVALPSDIVWPYCWHILMRLDTTDLLRPVSADNSPSVSTFQI
ncbi:hypothetical protein TorRG33x02_074730 [Trema orientale]|uniref:Uncharacterized protein n=1 Tax=Trema orientale TaxID=63057 RepID=A0A2P5FG46_TREOI|nr:hypothetical protein TorRG33x02_074730 [Trema orientale]